MQVPWHWSLLTQVNSQRRPREGHTKLYQILKAASQGVYTHARPGARDAIFKREQKEVTLSFLCEGHMGDGKGKVVWERSVVHFLDEVCLTHPAARGGGWHPHRDWNSKIKGCCQPPNWDQFFQGNFQVLWLFRHFSSLPNEKLRHNFMRHPPMTENQEEEGRKEESIYKS